MLNFIGNLNYGIVGEFHSFVSFLCKSGLKKELIYETSYSLKDSQSRFIQTIIFKHFPVDKTDVHSLSLIQTITKKL